MGDSPLLLQRHCRLEFRVSRHGSDDPVGGAESFEDAVLIARAEISKGASRTWVDVVCVYEPQAMNDEAVVHVSKTSRADKGEKRLATWEVFPSDVVLCPAGGRKLEPRLYRLAEEVQS